MAKYRIKCIMRLLLAVLMAIILSGCIPAAEGDQLQLITDDPVQTEEVNEPEEENEAKETSSVDDASADEDIPELSLTRTPGKAPGDEEESAKYDKKEGSGNKLDKASREDNNPREDKKAKEEKKSKKDKKTKKENKTEEEDDKKSSGTPEKKQESISEDGIYHDLESVVLYYDKFGHLPSNFITKKEAKDLGWEGGKLDPYVKGGSIGGDHFGNYEKRLPSGKGIRYIECDIDTDGGKRGSKRLIISNDGRYYYTADHYDSFREVVVENGNITFAD